MTELLLPDGLLGRDRELEALLRVCDEVVGRGEGAQLEVVLISGEAGVGKTKLVREFAKLLPANTLVLSGACEAARQDAAFLPVAAALTSWCEDMLQRDAPTVLAARSALRGALGASASLLFALIPNFAELLDSPIDRPTRYFESRSRITYAFLALLRTLASFGAPTVLVIDNLHWADVSTLELLQLIGTVGRDLPLLLIGCYETGALDVSHPLGSLATALDEQCRQLVLTGWSPVEIATLLADVLKLGRDETMPLAEEVFVKTGGNIHQVCDLLRSLHADGGLYQDGPTGRWGWDMERVRQRALARNVQENLLRRLDSLAEPSRTCLYLGAQLGQYFDVRIVAQALGMSFETVGEAIFPARDAGLLQPVADTSVNRRTFLLGDIPENAACVFRFRHERLRQRALQLSQSRSAELLLALGRVLLNDASIPGEQIFVAVSLLTATRVEDWTRPERLRQAELCVMAGHKAKASSAYAAAADWLDCGLSLLPEDAWQRVPGLALVLHLEAAQAHFLNNDLERGDGLALEVIARSISLADSARAQELLIETAIAQRRYQLAAERAQAALASLGIEFPEDRSELADLEQTLRTGMPEAGRVDDLLYLPEMEHPKYLASLRILNAAIPALYYFQVERVPVAVLKMVDFCLKYGNAPQSATAYGAYAVILCASYGEMDLGYRFGQLAVAVSEKYPQSNLHARLAYLFNIFVRPWSEPLEESLLPLQQSIQPGIACGELQFTFHNALQYRGYRFFCGHNLETVAKDYDSLRLLMEQHQSTMHLEISRIWDNLFHALQGLPQDSENIWPDAQTLAAWRGQNNVYALFFTYFTAMLCSFFEHNYVAAANAGKLCSEINTGCSVSFYRAAFHFYYSLTLLRLPGRPNPSERRNIRVMMAALRRWKLRVPKNFTHLCALLEAEYVFALGAKQAAGRLYDRALGLCRASGRMQDLAICQEATARYMHAQGMTVAAELLLREAVLNYREWGALGVALALGLEVTSQEAVSVHHLSGRAPELAFIARATRVFTRATDVDGILRNLMRMVMDRSGAARGGLFRNNAGCWSDAVWMDGDTAHIALEGGLEMVPLLPDTVIDHVARSGETLFLQIPAANPRFELPPFLVERGCSSLFCQGLTVHHANIAVLYLEFSRHGMALPSELVTLLNHLGTLMAMAIEHDLVVHERETLLENRARELDHSRDALRRAEGRLLSQEPLARLGELMAGMVQEVTTPLGTALTALTALEEVRQEVQRGYRAGRLRRDLFDRFVQQSEDGFRILRSNLMRSGELLRNFRQISLDQTDDERQIFIFKQYLERILGSLEPEIKRSGYLVVVRCDDTVVLDSFPGIWVQIFTSLIMDALQRNFSAGKKGRITIEVLVQSDLLISVRDSGRKMVGDVQKYLFESDSSPLFGTGNLVYGLITGRLGGTVTCMAMQGGGVEYLIQVPGDCVRSDPETMGVGRGAHYGLLHH